MNDKKRLKFEERLKTIVGGYCYAKGGGDGGYDFGDIVKHIDKATQEARADERARVVGEIENLDRHSDSRCAELECSEDGYTNGLDDVLALIRAELTNKD